MSRRRDGRDLGGRPMPGGFGDPPRPANDPELVDLFAEDPDLIQVARLLHDSRPEPVLDPRFPALLRARLMREAQTALAPRRRFHLRLAPGLAAWGTFAVGAAMATAAVIAVLSTRAPAPAGPAVVASNVSHQRAVDPNQTITLSFNQPMNEQDSQSVLQSLKIQPATQVAVTWKNPQTLVVTPLHPLAANTDYQVTIPGAALRSQSGKPLTSNVSIDFGTQPTPSPSPTPPPPPSLSTSAVGPAVGGGTAFWGPGGAPGVTSSTAGQPVPTSTPTAQASGSPTASAQPTSSATPTAAPGPAEGAAIFPPGQPALALSDGPATAVAVSPYSLALAVSDSGGSSTIWVEGTDGGQRYRVWPSGSAEPAPVTAMAWDGANRLVFVTPSGIAAVDVTNRQVSSLYTFPPGGSGSGVVLAPDGQLAFLPADDVTAAPAGASASPSPTPPTSATTSPSPATTALPTSAPGSATPTSAPGGAPGNGSLLSLQPGSAPTPLAGSADGVVAFSGDSQMVAWLDASGPAATVVEAKTADPAATTPVPGAPAGTRELALDLHGATLAYALPAGIEVQRANGAVLGTASTPATSLALSADGSRLVLVTGASLDTATVPTGSIVPIASPCRGGDGVLSQFVQDQVAGDQAGASALSAPGAGSGALTVPGVDRGYVISSGCTPAAGQSGPTLAASARLIVDPSPEAPGELTDESLALSQSQGGVWLVTQVDIPPLHQQGGGPHVISVAVTPPATGSANPVTVVTVTFDSDIEPATISSDSLWLENVTTGQPIPLEGTPGYDPDTREATLVVGGSLPAGAQTDVEVGTALSDIDGGHPRAQSPYPIGG